MKKLDKKQKYARDWSRVNIIVLHLNFYDMDKFGVVVAFIAFTLIIFIFIVPVLGKKFGNFYSDLQQEKAKRKGKELTPYGCSKARDEGESIVFLLITLLLMMLGVLIICFM